MPVDCMLENAQVPVFSRNKIDSFCKKYKIKQLPLAKCKDFQTSDGNHLNGESATKYVNFFYDQVKIVQDSQ